MNHGWDIVDLDVKIHWAAQDGNVETMLNIYENAERHEAQHGERPRWLGPDTVTVKDRPPVNREKGWTPLHVAVRFGRVAFVEALIARGAEVGPLTEKGRTPLAVAAIYGHEKLAQVLINASGAELNLADHEGRTPFDYASDERHIDVLRVLINAGFDFGELERERHPRRDWKGWCSRAITAHCGPARPRAPPADWDVELQDSLEEHLRLLLVQGGADPDFRCPQGTGTALHVAVRCNIISAARVLIELGATVDRRATRGSKTPLALACQMGSNCEPMAKMLLDAGALAMPEQAREGETARDVADSEGWQPIHRCVRPGWDAWQGRDRRFEPSVDFISYMLRRGPLITLAQNVVAAGPRRQRRWEKNIKLARQTLGEDFDSTLARILASLGRDDDAMIDENLFRAVEERIQAAAAAPPAEESDAQEGNSNEESAHELEESERRTDDSL